MPDTFVRWPLILDQMEAEAAGDDRRYHIARARARLHQALDCERIGPERSLLLDEAAEHFRAAGMDDDAARCDRAVWNDGTLPELLREVWDE